MTMDLTDTQRRMEGAVSSLENDFAEGHGPLYEAFKKLWNCFV